MHFSCAFYLQTQATAMDTDDYDEKVTQNTDAQPSVSITNINTHMPCRDAQLWHVNLQTKILMYFLHNY